MIHSLNTKPYDVLIVGGGVLGLWAARHAIKRGERVALVEKRHIGAGASGGFLGALMPHMPDNWNAKKQFQLEGLSSLPHVISQLEAETGVNCGYRRCGRIMPIPHEKLLKQIDRRLEGSATNWKGHFQMQILDAADTPINSEVAKYGVQFDTLAARINPRAYVKALHTHVSAQCDVFEGVEVTAIDASEVAPSVCLQDGERISAARLVIANGYEAYPLLQPFMGEMNNAKPIGRGVKGQAVLLEYAHDDSLPIIYNDGTYIVPHLGNRVAIGSTSVNDWAGQQASSFDSDDMQFYENAIKLMPELARAPIVERWAAVRPRNTIEGRGTEPFFGPVRGHEAITALIGGFKITLGIAHIAEFV